MADGVMLKGHVKGHVRRNGSIVKPHWRNAARFAAKKHHGQKRGDGRTPYIQHPIAVARILHDEAGVQDDATIMAALLHDTIEDTDATEEELASLFGKDVASIVLEVTNPHGISGQEKKRWQIEHAPTLSEKARAVKLADKIANLRDIIDMPPGWDVSRKESYYDHAAMVVGAMNQPHPALRDLFAEQYKSGRKKITS